MMKRLDALVSMDLTKMGLSTRERRAIWDRVHPKIRKAIPVDALSALLTGKVPARGFALGSDTGTGKTMALACIMRQYATARRRSFILGLAERTKAHPEKTFALGCPPIVWIHWPDTVTTLRAHAIDGEAEAILERAETAPLLILDDLGRERIKGSYLEDWAASQLDRIVNHRYREELPTIWTSNLKETVLTGIYGAALISRLTEDAPLVCLEGLPSMRIQ